MVDSPLLGPGDPDPVEITNPSGQSPFVLTCEHAGRAVPASLGDLGVPVEEWERHIAWDIGADPVAKLLSGALDAPLVSQRYSRLVIDCNRPLGVAQHVPEVSDGTPIPGNAGLSDAERQVRHAGIHVPLHSAITSLLDTRLAAAKATALIAVHSFTPMMRTEGVLRPWHIGLLYNRDPTLSHHVGEELRRNEPDLIVDYNEPYVVEDDGDYTIPAHGERRNLPHSLLEIRNDQIAGESGQSRYAALLARALTEIIPLL